MSWGTCYDVCKDATNNIHFNYPPLVSDGRLFTAYDSSEATSQKIKQMEGLQTNWQYRQYLQKNACNIMKYNNFECYYDLGLNPGVSSSQKSLNSPMLYTCIDDNRRPEYGYCNSTLKNYYLSREQLNSKLISPSINLNVPLR